MDKSLLLLLISHIQRQALNTDVLLATIISNSVTDESQDMADLFCLVSYLSVMQTSESLKANQPCNAEQSYTLLTPLSSMDVEGHSSAQDRSARIKAVRILFILFHLANISKKREVQIASFTFRFITCLINCISILIKNRRDLMLPKLFLFSVSNQKYSISLPREGLSY